jgi:hypothetical protein
MENMWTERWPFNGHRKGGKLVKWESNWELVPPDPQTVNGRPALESTKIRKHGVVLEVNKFYFPFTRSVHKPCAKKAKKL